MKHLWTLMFLVCLTTHMRSQERNADSLDVGRANVFIIHDTANGYVGTSNNISYIIDAKDLERDTEYDMVYRILSRRERILVIQLIKAEHSDRENAKRRGALSKLLNRE